MGRQHGVMLLDGRFFCKSDTQLDRHSPDLKLTYQPVPKKIALSAQLQAEKRPP
jgi:hypothetical protein